MQNPEHYVMSDGKRVAHLKVGPTNSSLITQELHRHHYRIHAHSDQHPPDLLAGTWDESDKVRFLGALLAMFPKNQMSVQ